MTFARTHIGIISALLLLPGVAFGAQLHLGQPVVVVRQGDEIEVPVSLEPGSEVLNAFEGSLHFSPTLTLRAVRFTNSLVPLWVVQPAERSKGIVSFAGVFPGGYQEQYSQGSRSGNLFILVFEAKAIGGSSVFTGPDTAGYENDGAGTRVQLSVASLSFAVLPVSGSARKLDITDTTPPEPFEPVIVSGEPYGFSGEALIFDTQDKDSGVARYEVARSYAGTASRSLVWEIGQSPYQLSPSDGDKFLFVRAFDQGGNTRIATVSPREISLQSFFHRFALLLALLLVLGVILCYRFLKGRRQPPSGILDGDAAGS